jgi:hypothetical protein
VAARLPGRGLGASGGGAPRWRSSWLPCQGALGAAGAPAPGAGRRPGAPSVARQPTFKSAPEPETTGPAAPPEDAAWPGPACSQPQGPGSPSPCPGQTGPWHWQALRLASGPQAPGPGPVRPDEREGGHFRVLPAGAGVAVAIKPPKKDKRAASYHGCKGPSDMKATGDHRPNVDRVAGLPVSPRHERSESAAAASDATQC